MLSYTAANSSTLLTPYLSETCFSIILPFIPITPLSWKFIVWNVTWICDEHHTSRPSHPPNFSHSYNVQNTVYIYIYLMKLFIINLRNTVYFITNLSSVSQGVCIKLGLIQHCSVRQHVTTKIRLKFNMWTSEVVFCRTNCRILTATQRQFINFGDHSDN